MSTRTPIPRPSKKSEYEIRFASTGAQKGWRDLVATIRNPMADAWGFLTVLNAGVLRPRRGGH